MRSSYILYAVASDAENCHNMLDTPCVLCKYDLFYYIASELHYTHEFFTSATYRGGKITVVEGANNIYVRAHHEWHRAEAWNTLRAFCKEYGGYLDKAAWEKLAEWQGVTLRDPGKITAWIKEHKLPYTGQNVGNAWECLGAYALGEDREWVHPNGIPDFTLANGDTVEFKTNGGTEYRC